MNKDDDNIVLFIRRVSFAAVYLLFLPGARTQLIIIIIITVLTLLFSLTLEPAWARGHAGGEHVHVRACMHAARAVKITNNIMPYEVHVRV